MCDFPVWRKNHCFGVGLGCNRGITSQIRLKYCKPAYIQLKRRHERQNPVAYTKVSNVRQSLENIEKNTIWCTNGVLLAYFEMFQVWKALCLLAFKVFIPLNFSLSGLLYRKWQFLAKPRKVRKYVHFGEWQFQLNQQKRAK